MPVVKASHHVISQVKSDGHDDKECEDDHHDEHQDAHTAHDNEEHEGADHAAELDEHDHDPEQHQEDQEEAIADHFFSHVKSANSSHAAATDVKTEKQQDHKLAEELLQGADSANDRSPLLKTVPTAEANSGLSQVQKDVFNAAKEHASKSDDAMIDEVFHSYSHLSKKGSEAEESRDITMENAYMAT